MSTIRSCQYFRRIIINSFNNHTKLKENKFHPNRNFYSLPVLFKYSAETDENSKSYTKNKYFKKNIISEEQSYLLAENDPEVFGTLTPSTSFADKIVDEGDLKEEEFIRSPPSRSQKLSTKQYADIIKDHLKNKRIKEAIDVLEIKMIKEDRVQPENYIFNLLIGACARFGYTKKAFELFTKMKQRDLKVTGGTYTALFNACANTPYLEDGLNKANHLRVLMIEKGYEPNITNYNSMIKAYGRCGDIKTAFQLVDEMKMKNLDLQIDTINFLFQACASDTEFGFRHALLIWHKMLSKKLEPNIFTFNLLLRCTRDCEIGDLDSMKQVIQQILLHSQNKQMKQIEQNQKLKDEVIEKNEENNIITFGENSEVQEEEGTPNLMARKPHLGNLISLSEVTKPEDRLLLLGGVSGILNEMEFYKITPDIKTFTELLEVIPGTHSAEKKIIASIRRIGIKVDCDFFNVLIKKRSMRFDYESAKEVLTMIRTAKLEPDIVTYGVLALGCQTEHQAMELLGQMKEQGIRMNIQILGAMLKQGCYKPNFNYIKNIIKIMKNEKIKPNGQFISHLDKFKNYCQNVIKQKHPTASARRFREDFKKFKEIHDELLEEFELTGLTLEEAIKKLKIHPYEQFKTVQETGYEKVKGEKLRHEKKLKRYIKRINPDKLSDGKLKDKKDVLE